MRITMPMIGGGVALLAGLGKDKSSGLGTIEVSISGVYIRIQRI